LPEGKCSSYALGISMFSFQEKSKSKDMNFNDKLISLRPVFVPSKNSKISFPEHDDSVVLKNAVS